MDICKQRDCCAPQKEGDDYCTTHSAGRWLCHHYLDEARDIHEVKNWLLEYVLPQAMDNIR